MNTNIAKAVAVHRANQDARREEYVFLTRVMGVDGPRAAADLGVNFRTAERWEQDIRANPELGVWHAAPTRAQIDRMNLAAGIDPRRRDRVPLRAVR